MQSKRKEIGNECFPIDSLAWNFIEEKNAVVRLTFAVAMPFSSLRRSYVTGWKGCSLFSHFFSHLSFYDYVLFFRTQHNFSLAKKRLTKIWSNSLVKPPHTRIQPQKTHRYCFFFYPFHDQYIESFERKTLPSILLSHDTRWFFIGYTIIFFALWPCHDLASPPAVFTRR